MALKYLYDHTYAIEGWFDPHLMDEGWYDQEFTAAAVVPPAESTLPSLIAIAHVNQLALGF